METKTYTLYWRTGDRDVIKGYDIQHAFTMAGYGGGAMGALDFYANGDNDEYAWNKETRNWDMIKPLV